jgi:hypothetical protein
VFELYVVSSASFLIMFNLRFGLICCPKLRFHFPPILSVG